jgi:hypothetical protein
MTQPFEEHLRRPVQCRSCGWVGLSGHVVLADSRTHLTCPNCKSPDIEYSVIEAGQFISELSAEGALQVEAGQELDQGPQSEVVGIPAD